MQSEETAVAVVPDAPAMLMDPAKMMDFGKDLADYIKSNGLTTKIRDKDYVEVEGWQYGGAMLGLVAVPETLECLSDDKEVKYRAFVAIRRMSDGQQVGAGFAICSNKEGNKRKWDEYAIASMAQTRAVGKGYRNLLAWLIKAAGYEPTPAEEARESRYKEHETPRARPEDVAFPKSWRSQGWPKTVGDCNKEQLNRLIEYCDESGEAPELGDAARALAMPKGAA